MSNIASFPNLRNTFSSSESEEAKMRKLLNLLFLGGLIALKEVSSYNTPPIDDSSPVPVSQNLLEEIFGTPEVSEEPCTVGGEVCSDNGVCSEAGECVCDEGYTGDQCQTCSVRIEKFAFRSFVPDSHHLQKFVAGEKNVEEKKGEIPETF